MTHIPSAVLRDCDVDASKRFGKEIHKDLEMSKQAEFAVILKMNAMFADLGADELQRLSNLCHTQHLANGEVLFQKGVAGDALFGLLRGLVRIVTGASDGSRLTLNGGGAGGRGGGGAGRD